MILDAYRGGAVALCLCITLSVVSRTFAATYVVDQKHPAATDDNPGSPERPLRSIHKAADLARAGDTVLVKPGLYREAVPLYYSGTLSAPIRFRADPPGSVTVCGSDLVTDWTPLEGADAIYSTPWRCVFAIDTINGQPLEFHPPGHELWGRAEQAFADGKPLKPCLSLEELRKNRTEFSAATKAKRASPVLDTPRPNLGQPFAGMFFADTRQTRRLYLWLADGSDPRQHQMELATRDLVIGTNEFAFHEGTQYVEVSGFIFRHGATFAQRPAVWLHGQHNLVENCVIENMSGDGIIVNGTMRRCIVRGNGYCGDGAGGNGFLNEESLWEGNCWKPFNRDWGAGGMKNCVCDGGEVRRCVFRRNGGPGLWFDIHCRNILVTECVFSENEGSGLFVEISRNVQVLNNLFVRNAVDVVGKLEEGGWSSGGLHFGESMNCVAAWNTLVGNRDGITFRDLGPRIENTPDYGEIPYHVTGDIVEANVCANNQQYALGFWSDASFFGWHPNDHAKYSNEDAWRADAVKLPSYAWDPATINLTMDRNLYFNGDKAPQFLYGVPWRPKHKVVEAAEWTKLTGFDARSRHGDPNFEDAAHSNFRIKREGAAWEMQAGWLRAPTDVDAWLKEFLPAFK